MNGWLTRRYGLAQALLVSACLSLTPLAMATTQEQPPEVCAQLNPLVVTGTRTYRNLEDSPVRTQVVGREDLDRFQPRDLAEALRHLPGADLDFPTREGQGVKSFAFEFYVQQAGETEFSATPITWTGGAISNDARCFDFVSGQEVANCSGNDWDLQLGFEDRDFFLRTNSGPNGDGQAGSFGPFAWSNQQDFNSASDVPSPRPGFAADTTSGIFSEQSWYAYGVGGGHQLWPNYRVYLIDTDSNDAESSRYALQVIGYYDEAGQSGHLTLRYQSAEMKN